MSLQLVVGTAVTCLAAVSAFKLWVAIPKKGPIITVNPSYEARAVVANSAVPGAGMGLFAKVGVKAGEVIGEMGGQLVSKADPWNPSGYLVLLADCAVDKVPPYRFIDSKDHGGQVRRINFAPRRINGHETQFQNAAIRTTCDSPWVVFVAIKDIEAGQEIFTSYGPRYDYSGFMNEPAIRDHFCREAKVDCSQKWAWEP